MDIRVRTAQPAVRKLPTKMETSPQQEATPSPALDGFTFGANAGSSVVLTGGGVMAGMMAVGGLVYQATGSEALAIPIGLFGGGVAGLVGGAVAAKGIGSLGSKLDTQNSARGSLLAKTAVIGATAALLGGAGGVVETLAIVGAFGAIGAAVGQWGPS